MNVSILAIAASCLLGMPIANPVPPAPQSGAASGPAAASFPVDRVVERIASWMHPGSTVDADAFHPEFLKSVPITKIEEIVHSINFGKVQRIDPVLRDGRFAAKVNIEFEKSMVLPVRIEVEPVPPHRVISLWFEGPRSARKDLKSIASAFEEFPGITSFAVMKLPARGSDGIEYLAQHEPDLACGIGSAFKLYILGALVEDIEKGSMKWSDTILLKKEWMSWPSGVLQTWPAGSPVTLHTLATLMISQSDNTATDHLLFHLGRERVEAMLAPMGNTHAERNIPFLSTQELFKMKGRESKPLRDRYKKATVAERRDILTNDVAPMDRTAVDLSAFATKPVAIETLEWFASAADLGRAMAWLLDHSETGAGAPARGVLSVNAGVIIPGNKFSFTGFKGGSETGVINLTHVFITKKGDRFATSASWNNKDAPVEDNKMIALVQGMVELLATQDAK